ncbi:MAG: polyphenol oxidase family protein [Brevinema sp.]
MIIDFFQDFPELIAGITTKVYGNCSNTLIKNKIVPTFHQYLLDFYRIKTITTARLIHSDITLNINQDILSCSADALITNQVDQLIAVTTADCIPVFIYDPMTVSIGIVHSGRKGLKQQITLNTIKKMINNFGVDPSKLIIQIGPHICASCYEVGIEILEEFQISSTQRYLPMEEILIKDLLSFGTLSENIRPSFYCTLCSKDAQGNPLFFSHRRKDPERMLSFIGIRANYNCFTKEIP